MVVYKSADLGPFVRKIEQRKTAIVKQSTNNVFQRASRTRAGTSRGGTVVAGYVPRADGFLAASAVSSLNGSTAISGEDAYILTIARMKQGDVAILGWTAAYARAQHYKGWLWMDEAANAWQDIVSDVVKEVNRRFP